MENQAIQDILERLKTLEDKVKKLEKEVYPPKEPQIITETKRQPPRKV